MLKLIPLFSCLALASGLTPAAAAAACACASPSDIKIGGYLGQRLDACLERNVKNTDGQYLTELFKNRTEKNTWQTEFWGKWMHASVTLPNTGNKITVEQKTDYPAGDTVTLTVTPAQEASFALKLRIPAWSTATTVAVNGTPVADVKPGAYLPPARTWKAGDTWKEESLYRVWQRIPLNVTKAPYVPYNPPSRMIL